MSVVQPIKSQLTWIIMLIWLQSNKGEAGIPTNYYDQWHEPGNTKGRSITVPLTSCLTGLVLAVWQLTIVVFIFKAVKQEVNGTVILPPLVLWKISELFEWKS